MGKAPSAAPSTLASPANPFRTCTTCCKVHAKKPLDIIFFPMIDCLTSLLTHIQASRTCPTVATTPEA